MSCLEAQYNTQKRRADSLKTERDHILKLFKNVNSETTRLYTENREYKHHKEQNNKQGVKKMTYRERLTIEHPERIDSEMLGGCDGCPADYGYSDDHHADNCPFDRPSPENCTKCWNREYVRATHSFVTFKDGHEEAIVFYQTQNNKVLFATRSGIYFCEEYFDDVMDVRTTYYRFRVPDNPAIRYETESVDIIASITLNSKVRREYCIDLKTGPHIHGSLVASRDISDEAFREMCIRDAIKNVTFKDV